MPVLFHLNYCQYCGVYLGMEDFDGICGVCELLYCYCGRKLAKNNKSGECWYCSGRAPGHLYTIYTQSWKENRIRMFKNGFVLRSINSYGIVIYWTGKQRYWTLQWVWAHVYKNASAAKQASKRLANSLDGQFAAGAIEVVPVEQICERVIE